MSAGNKIIVSTVNEISWVTDDNSYQRAKKKIVSLKQAHEKPAKAYQQTQKKVQQTEGKAALASAKAQTAKLKQAQQLGKEQQKQAQIEAARQAAEMAHSKKMATLAAKSQTDQAKNAEVLARQNLRLANISAKVRAASQHRAMTYNPDAPSLGREHYNPGLATRQNAQMSRGGRVQVSDIAAAKRRIADEEKREAVLKREVVYYNSLRRSALVLSNINGADVATRYKAIRAAKEALKAQKEERYTVEETRFEMARITGELRKQARIQQRITKEQKAAGMVPGRVRSEKHGGRGGLAAAGVVGGAALAGSMGISRAGDVLQGSLERSRDVKKLEQYNISQLEFAALQDLAMSRAGYSLSADKLADLNKDVTEKSGELINTGSFKKDKKTGQVSFSGGGEFADIVNMTLKSTNGNQKAAQTVIDELQKMNFPTFISYLKQLQTTFKWTDNQVRHMSEAVNDGSIFLEVFKDQGQGVIDRMTKLSSEGWALSQAQQEQLTRLSALSTEYTRVQTSLSDHFSSSFVQGLGDYATNTDNLSTGMKGLIPITDGLGKSLGEMSAAVLSLTNWFNSWEINPENKHEQLSDNGLYYRDSAGGRLWTSLKKAAETFTGASVIPGVTQTPQAALGPGTAWNNAPLSFGVPSMDYNFTLQQPTFSPPGVSSLTQQRAMPVNVTGSADLKLDQQMDVYVHDGAVVGLVDTKIRENDLKNVNLLFAIE
jgi:hypothetical protein